MAPKPQLFWGLFFQQYCFTQLTPDMGFPSIKRCWYFSYFSIKSISQDTQKIPQSRSTAFLRHKKRWGTKIDKGNATYETTHPQIKKNWNGGIALELLGGLTLLLLNSSCPVLANSVDPDQLASEEANWPGSALFVIKYVCLCWGFMPQLNPIGSCRARSVYLTTRLLGRLSRLSG